MTDTRFFTNEEGSTLLDRFQKVLKGAEFFDVLVGFFRALGFFKIYIITFKECAIPKHITKNTLKALNNLKSDLTNPLKILAAIKHTIPEKLLKAHYAEHLGRYSGKKEVILSLYLVGK